MTAQPGGPGEPVQEQGAAAEPEAEAGGGQTSAVARSADAQIPSDTDAQIAGLADLFRRRLLEDRNNKIALDALHAELRDARAVADGKIVMPLIRRLFQVIDRLDGAPGQLADSVAAELVDILSMYEVEEILALTTDFDPATQEVAALLEARGPEEDGRVLAMRRRGWRLGQRVLRPVLVDVARLPASTPMAQRPIG